MPYSYPTWDEFQALSDRVLALELASPGGGIPPAPQNFAVFTDGEDYSLRWDAVLGVSYYRVYQQVSLDPAPHLYAETQNTEVPLGAPSQYEITFYVTAVNTIGESDPSGTVTH